MGIIKSPNKPKFKGLVKPTVPVVIDRENTYGKNVFAAWSFTGTDRLLIDDANDNRVASLEGSTFNPLHGDDGNMNMEHTGDNTTDRLDLGSITPGDPISLTEESTGGEFTIFFRSKTNTGALNNGFPRIIDKSDGGNAANGWYISWDESAQFDYFVDGSERATVVGMTKGDWIDVALVVSKSANTSTFYTQRSDGVNNSGSAAYFAAPSAVTNAAIGNWNHSTDRQWNGEIAYIHMHHTAYTEGQVRRYFSNPYQILKPARPLVVPLSTGVAAQDISPTGIASAEAFGTAVITTGAVDISPTGIASAEAFGTAVISQATFITPTGIVSAEAFGTAVITTGAVDISPTGIASAEAFGTAVITQAFIIEPTGIPSAEAFGTAVITTGAVDISPTGIASAEAFGTAVIAVAGDKDIKIDFANEKILNTNLQSTTLYFNGTDYFTID